MTIGSVALTLIFATTILHRIRGIAETAGIIAMAETTGTDGIVEIIGTIAMNTDHPAVNSPFDKRHRLVLILRDSMDQLALFETIQLTQTVGTEIATMHKHRVPANHDGYEVASITASTVATGSTSLANSKKQLTEFCYRRDLTRSRN